MDADDQGRQRSSRREVRACHRLQDAPTTSPPTTRASTKAATSWARSRPRCRRRGIAGYIVSFPIPEVVMGINCLHARRAVGQSGLQGEDRLGELLVRSGQGSRRRQGAVRPGRRHPRPAHRLAGRLQVAEERGMHGFGQSSDMIKLRPEGAADLDHRQLGPVLHRADARPCSTAPGSRRQTWEGFKDEHVMLWRRYTNMPDDVKAMAEATTRRSSPANCRRSPGRSPSRTAHRGRGRQGHFRRRPARHELLREGHRRQAAAIGVTSFGQRRRLGRCHRRASTLCHC